MKETMCQALIKVSQSTTIYLNTYLVWKLQIFTRCLGDDMLLMNTNFNLDKVTEKTVYIHIELLFNHTIESIELNFTI